MLVKDFFVEGEPFELERLSSDDSNSDGMPVRAGGFRLTHPRWSTVGVGATILEAEWDLIRCGQAVFPALTSTPVSKRDHEANRLTEWCYRIIGYQRTKYAA